MSDFPAAVDIRDDTMREGLQIEDRNISVDDKLRLLDALGETGLKVISIGYASTRADIHEHAATLGRVLARMKDVTQLDFVAHSMGNIVLRRYMAMQMNEKTRQPCPATIGRCLR